MIKESPLALIFRTWKVKVHPETGAPPNLNVFSWSDIFIGIRFTAFELISLTNNKHFLVQVELTNGA